MILILHVDSQSRAGAKCVSVIANFTILIIGFSVISSGALLFSYVFFLREMRKTKLGLASCAVLLICLSCLQLAHFWYLQSGVDLLSLRIYALLLLTAPLAFYFFSKEILMPDTRQSYVQLLHLAPLPLGAAYPTSIVVPIAFAIGAGYSFWFARVIYNLGEQRRRFKFEMFFFGLFALLAFLALILGLSIGFINHGLFYIAYANFIGIAFLLIVSALIIFPELLSDISEAAELAYASTTLGNVDVDAALARLDELMNVDKMFQNENLNLPLLAEALQLSSHQLSELINSEFGYGFSRYVRERRIAEAKRLFSEDPQSSILAISLMTGFRSQSNFYAAFREVVGEAPGRYRKKLQSG